MELLVFSLFAAALLVCVIFHISLLFALLLGYVIFALYAIRKGFSLPEVLGMSAQGVRAAKNILTTFVLIGILTSLWRAGGTIPAIVCYSVRVMEPRLFLVCSFLLNCLVSFLTGTAFGSAATMGAVCMTMAAALGGDWQEDVRAFAENLDGRQLDSSGAVLDEVADGGAWLGVALEETALKYVSDGADVSLVYPKEGTSAVPDASALVKGAPHEDNAKKFLDFTISQDVQQLLGERFYRRPVRSDVSGDESLPDLAGIRLVDYDVDWASKNREGILMTWAFYLDGEGAA